MSDTSPESVLRELAASRREVVLPPPDQRRALRVLAELLQADIAEVIGTSRVAVTRYESGAREPHGEIRLRYAEALEVLRRGLLDLAQEPPEPELRP